MGVGRGWVRVRGVNSNVVMWTWQFENITVDVKIASLIVVKDHGI